MSERPLLMIPGPIEISPTVLEAFAVPPPSHVSPAVIEAFGSSIARLRTVFCAGADAQPFVIAGSGTLAMEMAATNAVDPGERALVVNTGYFGDRMAEMLRRRGAEVTQVTAAIGDTVSGEIVADALDGGDFTAVFATHVDTSTGVRVDAESIARVARERDVLSVFDGVCATAGEVFRQSAWGADIYLTGSQKALGLPAGLAVVVSSARAMAKRRASKSPPPMTIDTLQWLPIMEAYEARKPSYFATPATNHILALARAIDELLDDEGSMERTFADHGRVADAMRAAWAALGLELLVSDPNHAANTLSAIRYPAGVDASLVGAIKAGGVVVAGGLHPACKATYFRVGHMGYATRRPDMLRKTVQAVENGLRTQGREVREGVGVEALNQVLGESA